MHRATFLMTDREVLALYHRPRDSADSRFGQKWLKWPQMKLNFMINEFLRSIIFTLLWNYGIEAMHNFSAKNLTFHEWKTHMNGLTTIVVQISPQAKRYVLIWFKHLIPPTCLKPFQDNYLSRCMWLVNRFQVVCQSITSDS